MPLGQCAATGFYALIVCSLCVQWVSGAQQYQPEFFASPHPDDWQLFSGRRAARDMVDHPDWRAVLLHISAGDAGCPWCTYNPENECPGFKESVDTKSCQKPTAMFWADAREKGNIASVVALMKNTLPSEAKVSVKSETVKLLSHNIMKYTIFNNINDKTYVAYMFRLPDGGFNSVSGSSYHNYTSLTNLLSGANSSVSAIDGSTTYTSAADFNATVQAVIDLELGSFRKASVHSIDPWYAGHPDHSALSWVMETVVAREAEAGRELNLYYYEDYIVGDHPAEINPYEDFILKLSINTVYYDSMSAAPYGYKADWLDDHIPHYYNYAQFMIKENCTRLYKIGDPPTLPTASRSFLTEARPILIVVAAVVGLATWLLSPGRTN